MSAATRSTARMARAATAPEIQPRGQALLTGGLAGMAGGLVFGAALTELAPLPSMALLMVTGSAALGFLLHMLVGGVLGSGFGLLLRWRRAGPGETVAYGVAYGALWWYAGPLTLMPILLGVDPAWGLQVAQEQFAGLVGHLLWGGVTGLAVVLLRRPARPGLPSFRLGEGRLASGMLAGVAGAWLVAALFGTGPTGIAALTGRALGVGPVLAATLVGPLVGLGYALLFPRTTSGTGVAIIRGQVYGFLWWIAADLTLVPLLGGELTWSIDAARTAFGALPGFLLLGVAVATLDRWVHATSRLLFSDDVREVSQLRARGGLPAVARDMAAGSAGGLLFTLAMHQTGYLATVARLAGSDSELAGFAVHLLISTAIGVTFGQLFRDDHGDLGSSLGWGLAYGFLWWNLGALTLLPMLLGGPPQWAAGEAAGAFGSLIGHLAYGLGLSAAFHALETRLGTGRIRRALGEDRTDGGRAAVVATAPALSAVTLVIVLVVPMVLAGTR